MRYRDAGHVDVGGFYARRPQVGKVYRFLGYAGIAAAALTRPTPGCWCFEYLLIALVLVWLAAWYQVVGTLWRSALVAAILVSAIGATLHHLQSAGATGGAGL